MHIIKSFNKKSSPNIIISVFHNTTNGTNWRREKRIYLDKNSIHKKCVSLSFFYWFDSFFRVGKICFYVHNDRRGWCQKLWFFPNGTQCFLRTSRWQAIKNGAAIKLQCVWQLWTKNLIKRINWITENSNIMDLHWGWRQMFSANLKGCKFGFSSNISVWALNILE